MSSMLILVVVAAAALQVAECKSAKREYWVRWMQSNPIHANDAAYHSNELIFYCRNHIGQTWVRYLTLKSLLHLICKRIKQVCWLNLSSWCFFSLSMIFLYYSICLFLQTVFVKPKPTLIVTWSTCAVPVSSCSPKKRLTTTTPQKNAKNGVANWRPSTPSPRPNSFLACWRRANGLGSAEIASTAKSSKMTNGCGCLETGLTFRIPCGRFTVVKSHLTTSEWNQLFRLISFLWCHTFRRKHCLKNNLVFLKFWRRRNSFDGL